MSPRCPSCSNELPEGQRYCGRCGADTGTGATAAATATSTPDSSFESAASAGGPRFSAGTVIAGRYRIVGLLGRGGMGEVYRADDLKLVRPVALKFLPGDVEQQPSRLNRLLHEVRTALSVSHPNVCRVHDVQQEAGRHFITMEFVDGDDLATLLRRIGRLPSDKALEIARQLCAGLGAAHAAGVLHRDLKPANIMIDGRGQVKITDFGLAGLAGDFTGDDLRAGTPAYMAPEQLAGEQVSAASDIYALGLVLYEVYTGKPAYRGSTAAEIARNRTSVPTSPSSHITDIDPAVERVILRCLEHDSKVRPASALAVSAALPGGDPLAAALAAGETPAPELVAEAGAVGGLSPRKAWALLGTFLALLAWDVFWNPAANAVSHAHLPKSGEVLQEKAREILVSLGYDEPWRDSIYEFRYDSDYIRHLREEGGDGRAGLKSPQPAAIRFGYRQSPDWIRFETPGTVSDWLGGTPTLPGALRIGLDPLGRLLWLDVTPPELPPDASVDEPDWGALLDAAGFDESALTEVEPRWLPRRGFDRRRAWEGVFPDAPEVPVRLEAAALAGRAVSFRIIEPWTQPAEADVPSVASRFSPTGIGPILGPVLWTILLIAAGVFAWRNVRLGRGDRRTAVRFALLLAAVRLAWYVFTHHAASGSELSSLQAHLAWTMYRFGMGYVFYLAIEPYARKLWPHMLTSWVRLFSGRLRDPLVGRDLLVGVVLGAGTFAVAAVVVQVAEQIGASLPPPATDQQSLESLRGLKGAFLGPLVLASLQALDLLVFLMFILVARLILRRDWLALVAFLGVNVLFNLQDGPTRVAIAILVASFLWIALFRFGLLTVVVTALVAELIRLVPMSFHFGAWWTAPMWITLAAISFVALWGFRASLAGRPVLRDRLFEAPS